MKKKLLKLFKKKAKAKPPKAKVQQEQVVNVFNPHKWFYTNDDSRINIKITQSLLFAFVLSLCGNIFLMILIIIMLPLKEKVPTFVHFLPKEEQIVYMEEFKTNKKALKRVKEFLARDYIKKRESIDLTTEEKRYPLVYYLSSPAIAKEFDDEFNADKNPLSPYKLAVDNAWLRYVRIISSEMLNANQIRVEFEATTTAKSNNEVLLTEIIIAIVSFSDDTKKYKGADYLANPFGFVVSDYSLSVKERRDNQNKRSISKYKKIKKGKKNDTKKPVRAFN